MNEPTVRMFWQRYFAATQHLLPSWLARLSAARRVEMLDELMQWGVTTRLFNDPARNRHV